MPAHPGAQFGQLPRQLHAFPIQIPKTTEKESPSKMEKRACAVSSASLFTKMSFQFTFSQIQSSVLGDKKIEQKIKTVREDQCHSLVASSIHPSTARKEIV